MIIPDKLTQRERKFCIVVVVLGMAIFLGCALVEYIFHIGDYHNMANFIYIFGGIGIGLSFAPFFMEE